MKIINKFILGSIVIGGLLFNTLAQAALTGTCGMIATPPIAPGASQSTYNVLALINFSSNTITYSAMDLTFSGGSATASQAYYTKTITVSSNSNMSGAYTLSFLNGSGSHTLTFNLLPVNSGNTILIQGTSDPFSGVCQMQ